MPRPQPPIKFNQQHTLTRTQAVIPVITFKPATPDTNAIDLTRSKLTAKKKQCCRTEGLYFYCGQVCYQTFFGPIKLANKHVKTIQNIQDTPAAKPTPDSSQDLGKNSL